MSFDLLIASYEDKITTCSPFRILILKCNPFLMRQQEIHAMCLRPTNILCFPGAIAVLDIHVSVWTALQDICDWHISESPAWSSSGPACPWPLASRSIGTAPSNLDGMIMEDLGRKDSISKWRTRLVRALQQPFSRPAYATRLSLVQSL